MPVFSGSRYEGLEYTAVTGQDLVTRKYLHLRESKTEEDVEPDWIVHEVSIGDDLDLLAYKYANNNASKSKLWWLIAAVNGLLWPLDVEPGSDLMIPVRDLASNGV